MILPALVVIALMSVGGYYLYRTVMTDVIAEVVIADSLPDYIPKRIQSRIQGITAPVNKGAEAVLHQMHTSDIPMEQLLAVIDETSEAQVYSLIDELNNTRPESTDEVFTIAKKHIAADFDPEIFRKSFTDQVSMKQVRKALFYADQNRRTHDLDFDIAKAIVKKYSLRKKRSITLNKTNRVISRCAGVHLIT